MRAQVCYNTQVWGGAWGAPKAAGALRQRPRRFGREEGLASAEERWGAGQRGWAREGRHSQKRVADGQYGRSKEVGSGTTTYRTPAGLLCCAVRRRRKRRGIGAGNCSGVHRKRGMEVQWGASGHKRSRTAGKYGCSDARYEHRDQTRRAGPVPAGDGDPPSQAPYSKTVG